MTTLIHVTHEAAEKMGGIGAVLEGLLTTRAYQAAVDRSILVGAASLPLAETPEHLLAALYHTGDPPHASLPEAAAAALRAVESAYGVRLLYASRRVPCPMETRQATAELLLVDVRDAHAGPVNDLKRRLWEVFGLESDKHEADWGYEEWVRLAGPALDAAAAILGPDAAGAALVSHEFMGMPTVLAARLRRPDMRTVYWAHEVPSVRDLIEQETGERLLFDRALETRRGLRPYARRLRDRGGFKHDLVSRACQASCVFAVSDRIAQELQLLSPQFRRTPVDVVYNGLPVRPISLEARMASRERMRTYVHAVVGFRPDYVFTHVARPVASKAIERDLAVLEHLDDRLADRGQTAVLLVLATEGPRAGGLVRQMEAEYGWPLHHRTGWPDLVKGEVPVGEAAEPYNAYARATRVILINQFGFSRETCGDRMPADVSFQDLRQGSDVEFGQSSYEPFGIAQLETLAFGGISVLTRACGCAQLLARVTGGAMPANVLMGCYAAPDADAEDDACRCAPISDADTRRIEHEIAAQLAHRLADILPREPQDFARLLESGWDLARRMSWQAVCQEYFLPALERCLGRACPRTPPEVFQRAGSPDPARA